MNNRMLPTALAQSKQLQAGRGEACWGPTRLPSSDPRSRRCPVHPRPDNAASVGMCPPLPKPLHWPAPRCQELSSVNSFFNFNLKPRPCLKKGQIS